ncbi:type VII secretion target [Streptomyces sp. NPDC048483]|uniref:type VII secretion target n=1 Tax=Streptomyces sp. NPDC048483 TaxID=3154927 RepID=UPI0034136C1A
MANNSGFHVQQEGMKSEAKKLDEAGEDVGDIKSAIADAVHFDNDILGGSDSGPAYNAFSHAWHDETKTLEGALHELADKVRKSQEDYHQADREAIVVTESAAAADARISTRPAPAGGSSPFG